MSLPQPTLEETPIPGMKVIRIPLYGDARGWFKENWQREKHVALGLPDFGPVQNNMSFNADRGATRGIHAEPWDKLVSIAHGKVYAAWVDLREGDSFGSTFSLELDPGVSVFVPRGVGNSYQALEDDTVYSYLVNDHWRPGVVYPAVHLGDETANIPWPIPLDDAEISEKDLANPRLADVTPMAPRRTLVIGSKGQLGRALEKVFPHASLVDLDELDFTNPEQVAAFSWQDYDVVLNAAAYTAVDAAETPEGRVACWAANASAPATLARLAREHRFTLVHYSTDYVFDGTAEVHTEDEPLAPLGVYGQSKAAGDLAVTGAPQHYVLRTSWVIGDGNNFVRTMASLAERGISPSVVSDQVGRLTFTETLAEASKHLLQVGAPYGVYNCTNGGDAMSWAEIAAEVFALSGRSKDDVTPVTTAEYFAGKEMSPRPLQSTLDLTKLEATGYAPEAALDALQRYLKG